MRKVFRKGLSSVLAASMMVSLSAPMVQAAGEATQMNEAGRILYLDFEDGDAGLSGDGVNVTVNGTTNYVDDSHMGKALSITPNTYLTLEGENGNLLAGKDELTVSYWSKTPSMTVCNWAAFMAPNSNAPVYLNENYFAISDQSSMRLERYRNGRDSEVTGSAAADTWKMVTAVIEESQTTLYINNKKISTVRSNYKLSDILGSNPIFYIGKATWGNGEYFTGILDDYSIYDYAMTEEQVKEKYLSESDVEAEIEKAVSQLYIPQAPEKASGNISLPSESKSGIKFEWTSSDENVISTKAVPCSAYYNEVDIPAGVVTRQKEDTAVELTLKASYGDVVKTYTYQVTVKAASWQEEKYAGYLYAHFNEHAGAAYDGIQQIFFGISKNGVDWTALNNNQYVVESNVGDYGVRDPYIIRSNEGDKFYLIGTDLDIDSYKYNGNWGIMASQGSQSLIVWESDDLVNWSEPRRVDVASDIDAGMAWAPEAIYDEATGEYLVFWSSGMKSGVQGNHIYVSKTRDFWNFTTPELYSNSANGEDAGRLSGNIDASIFKEGDTYYRLIKDESSNSIRLQSSKKLLAYGEDLGDETAVAVGNTTMPNRGAGFKLIDNSGTIQVKDESGNTVTKPCMQQYAWSYEGPTMFKFNDRDEWCILVDEYGRGSAAGSGSARGYIPFVTTNLDQPNSVYLPSDDEFVMPDAAKHGTVIPITQSEYDALMAKWGTPKQDGNKKETVKPVLTYDFESVEGTTVKDTSKAGADNTGTLNGTAKVTEVEGKGKVLQLDGNGSVSFPNGFFDGLSDMKLTMDVCPDANNTNTTVFSMGSTVTNKISSYTVTAAGVTERARYWDAADKISNRYFNLDVKANAVEGTITTINTFGEMKITSGNTQDMAGKWRHIEVIAEDHVISIYVDGALAAQEKHVRSIAELGTSLTAVLGSAYKDLGGFKGYIDNVNVYNTVKEPAFPYIDVPEDSWFYDYAFDLYKNNIMTGLDETHFGPEVAMNRAQFAVILHRMTNRPAEDYNLVFPDVLDDQYYTTAVLWANKNGIVTGFADSGLFKPADGITREQMAVMLYRYAKYLKADDLDVRGDLTAFADSSSVSEFAKEAMAWAVGTGLISGTSDGTLMPQGITVRAEGAAVISRFMNR